VGRWTLAHYQSVSLLMLAVPLLMALAIIRIVVYMLHLVFAQGTAVSTTGRVISWVVWTGFAIYISGYAPDLIDFLDDTGFHVGKQHISLLIVLQAMLSIVVALLVSLWLGRLFEGRVMEAQGMDINLRVMLSKLMRPLLVLIAILIALPMIGIDLTALSVFGGAIGVGIGFGLQKTASNYISGFIILLDRSVNIGDLVTIEKHTGQLTKMTARYLVLRDNDGTEAIIPNETVIASTVVNHSYSDKTVRIPITLQIGYRSDLNIAMRILVDAALSQPRVLKSPEPKVLVTAFADNGIELELGVWVNDPEEGRANLRSDIYCTAWREFQAKGIEIPYPQREVRLLDGHDTAVPPA
jgi:small-conductance mechanosensitive channel